MGTVTFESAAYIARYVTKKLNGPLAQQINKKTGLKHYERINTFTGEITEVLPEYSTMSTGRGDNRGIGYKWIKRYASDVYPKDFTTINGMRVSPPKYYDKYLNSIDPDLYDDIKAGRMLTAYNSTDNTVERLKAKESVKKAQFTQLKRSL